MNWLPCTVDVVNDLCKTSTAKYSCLRADLVDLQERNLVAIQF
jgi:hypothetical protein